MSLTAGTRLGPYEIVAPIGAGGMGEIYKARDTRLDRTVAIKRIQAALSADPEFKARFEREARTISALNHPHICTLHDIGHEHGIDYLVFEFLEGETLAARLEKGPLPVEHALKIGREICDALDRAHRHGITHRDLKPGNVMLTRSGAKLLDFGLAKPSGAVSADAPPLPRGADASLPTAMLANAPITTRGTILGTFQYMSPEQIEGQDADARSDIWSLGCLLYEALTGKHAFEGKTQASLVSAIIKDQPPAISGVQPLAPPGLDRVVATCLAKDPDARWQSAADLARELQWVMEARSSEAPRARAAGIARYERLGWAAVVITLTAVAALVYWRQPSSTAAGGPPTYGVVPLGARHALVPSFLPNLAVSPDGRYAAYRGNEGLILRALDEHESRPLAGTEGAAYPFFSPDSQSLGFVVGPTIKRIALSGGAPTVVAPGGGTAGGVPFRGVAWGDDDFIYYTPTVSAGLWRVPAAGGAAEELTRPDFAKGEKTHRWPFVLPGSKAVVFVVGTSRITTFDDARIEVLVLAGRERRKLVDGGTFPQAAPSGHLLYSHAGALLAVPFDADRLELRGSPIEVVTGTLRDDLYGMGNHSFSKTGTLVYAAGGTTGVTRTLASVDRRGTPQPLPVAPGFYGTGRVSRDGTRLVVFVNGATSQITTIDLSRGPASRMTFEWDNESPVWTPDDKFLTFTSNRGGGPRNLYRQPADGGGDAERLTTSDREQVPLDWSPDGRTLVFGETDPGTLGDIWYMSMDDRTPRVLVKTPGADGAARLSADGRWIAYQSNLAGQPEIYVQAFPAGGRRWQISIDGGTAPVWQRNGRELVYRRGNSVMAVAVNGDADFQYGSPVRLFDWPQPIMDVLPGGRFLMAAGTPMAPITELNLVVNWFEDLRRRMGAAK